MNPYEAEVTELRRRPVAALEVHEANCERGRGCAERFNLLAFLAHSLGVHTERIELLREKMADYEASCHQCSHRRN